MYDIILYKIMRFFFFFYLSKMFNLQPKTIKTNKSTFAAQMEDKQII